MIEINIPLERVFPNPWQPREGENPEHIRNLALSIAKDTLLQRPVGRLVDKDFKSIDGNEYYPDWLLSRIKDHGWKVQLAFGHSRLKAFEWLYRANMLGEYLDENGQMVTIPECIQMGEWASLPVAIKVIDDEEMFRLAISENLQRRDLTPIEEAKAMIRYRDEFGRTSVEIGALFGLSDGAVRNKMRLLRLPAMVQDMLRARAISEGAARALIGLYDLPEELRQAAEGQDEVATPSQIIEAAASGAAPGALSEMVERLVRRMDPQPVQMDLAQAAPSPENVSVETGEPFDDPQADAEALAGMQAAAAEWSQTDEDDDPQPEETIGADEADDFETAKPFNVVERAVVDRGASVSAGAGEAKPKAVERPVNESQPAATGRPEGGAAADKRADAVDGSDADPDKKLSWGESTIAMTLTFWPEDGHADGRMVMVGARVNGNPPVMRTARQADLHLPMQLAELFAELNKNYQEA